MFNSPCPCHPAAANLPPGWTHHQAEAEQLSYHHTLSCHLERSYNVNHTGALLCFFFSPSTHLICTHLYQFPCRWFSACPDVPKKILRLCSEKAAVKFQIVEHFIQHNLLAALCHTHIHAKGCSRVAVDLDLWWDLRGLDLEKKERKGVGLGPNWRLCCNNDFPSFHVAFTNVDRLTVQCVCVYFYWIFDIILCCRSKQRC